MSHGIETEVPDVGLFGKNEAPEQLGRRSDRLGFRVNVYSQVDRLEKYCVLRIVMLNILKHEDVNPCK